MATRLEVVKVILDDDFSPGALRMAAAAEVFRRELNRMGGNSRDVDSSMSRLGSRSDALGTSLRRSSTGLTDLNRGLDQTRSRLDTTSGRVGILADVLGSLGPTAVPIAGALVPALAASASALGAMAVGGVSAMVAMRGLGDAAKALSAYRDDPTAENLAKARAELEGLAPAAAEFVLKMDELRGLGKDLRDAGADGLFPGLTRSLDSLATRGPEAERILHNINSVLGNLAASGAQSLAGNEFDDFFKFLARDVPKDLQLVGQALGHVGSAAADMWMAMAPTGAKGLEALVRGTRDLSEWAANLGETQGFNDFIAYIERTGPQVGDILTDIGASAVALVEAAAPVGEAWLPILSAMASALRSLAESDLAAPLLMLLSLNRAMSLVGRAGTGAFGSGAVAGVQSYGASLRDNLRTIQAYGQAQQRASTYATQAMAMQARQQATLTRLTDRETAARERLNRNFSTANMQGAIRAMQAQQAAQERVTASQQRMNTVMAQQRTAVAQAAAARTAAFTSMSGQIGTSIAQIGALALMSSGAADSMGMTNTVMLGLAGSMTPAGPLGAGIGMAVGGFLDLKAAADGVDDAITGLNTALDSWDPAAIAAKQQTLTDTFGKSQEQVKGFTSSFGGLVGMTTDLLPSAWDKATGTTDDYNAALAETKAAQQQLQTSATALATAYGTELSGNVNTSAKAQQEWSNLLTRSKPAMDALGITLDDFAAAQERQRQAAIASATGNDALANSILASGPTVGQLANQIQAQTEAMESVKGRTEAVGAAIRGLGDDSASAAQDAQSLSAALQARLSPALNAEQAAIAQKEAMVALGKQLKSNSAGFGLNTAASRENAKASMAVVTSLQGRLVAMAENGASSEQLARHLNRTKANFIQEGVAAGRSAAQMRRRANEMGLTPKLVKTVFENAGIDQSRRQARQLAGQYRALPKNVRTHIQANGIPKSEAGMKKLKRQFDLTPRQVQTLVKMRDEASKKGNSIKAALKALDRQSAEPKADINDAGFKAKHKRDMSAMGELDRKRANPVVNLVDNATGKINSIKGAIASIQSKTVTITTVHKTVKERAGGGTMGRIFNGSGVVRGPGGPTDDLVNARLSNDEFVLRAAAHRYYGSSAAYALNSMLIPREALQGFASGGAFVDANRGVPVSRGAPQRVVVDVTSSGYLDVSTGQRLNLDTQVRSIVQDEIREDREWERRQKGRWSD